MLLSFWSRYRAALNIKHDLHEAYFRKHDRFATLDGARAITVLLMVMFHVLFGIIVLFDRNVEYIDNFITSFPRYLGWLWQSQGSDPLFLLCGLLVSYTLFREYDKTGKLNILRFYKRRLMRIVPLFLLCVLLFLSADPDNLQYLWSNLIFMSNYIEGQRHVIPVGWSLDVQLHFYFLLPFLVLLIFAVPWRIGLLVGLFILSVLWRFYIVVRDPEIYEHPFYDIIYNREYGSLLADQLYYDLDIRIGAFFLGVLVAYLHHYYKTEIKHFLSRHLIFNNVLVLLGFALIIGAVCLPVENRYHEFNQTFNPTFHLWWLALDRYVYCLGLSIVLMLALCPVGFSRQVDWVLSWRIWHPFAQLIFPIYLFHFIFIILGAVLTFWTTDRDSITEVHTWQVFAIFGWTVLLTLAFSTLAHLFIEKPFLTMREADGVKDASAIPNTVVVHQKAD